MNRIQLPGQDFTLSHYGAGFWRLRDWGFSTKDLQTFVMQLLEHGITTMDHAMVYRSEAIFGEMLAVDPSLRDNMEIVSKCGIRPPGFGELGADSIAYYDSSPEAIVASVDASLKNLNTDYLDVLLLHRPDYLMNVHEVAQTFKQLRAEGKVKAFGVSNFSPAQFDALNAACEVPLVTNQVECSVFQPDLLDAGIFDQCQSFGISPMLWSCLGGGRISQPTSSKEQALVQRASQMAEKYGVEHKEAIFYAWVNALPCAPMVLLGSSKLERLLSAVKTHSLILEKEDWYELLEISRGASVP